MSSVTSLANTTATSSTASASGSGSSLTTETAAQMQQNFLSLLVAQINNQDPLNPVDNSQMTSQMAQINTVGGIQQLNTSLQSLMTQFNSMQMLQGTSLVGQSVTIPGNSMLTSSSGTQAAGVFNLPSAASSVQVQVTDAGGNVLGTVNQGSLSAGQHTFTWDSTNYPNTPLSFKVTATNGTTKVSPTTYSLQTIQSVGMSNGALNLGLTNGQSVPYSSVSSIF